MNCNKTTNSVTSNYWLDVDVDGKTPKDIEVATVCYAAFVHGRWVKGCYYSDLDPTMKVVVDRLLSQQP